MLTRLTIKALRKMATMFGTPDDLKELEKRIVESQAEEDIRNLQVKQVKDSWKRTKSN